MRAVIFTCETQLDSDDEIVPPDVLRKALEVSECKVQNARRCRIR